MSVGRDLDSDGGEREGWGVVRVYDESKKHTPGRNKSFLVTLKKKGLTCLNVGHHQLKYSGEPNRRHGSIHQFVINPTKILPQKPTLNVNLVT